MRPDRRIEDLEERLDNLSRAHLRHSKVIRPNRFTRYDNDLVSRRELDANIAESLATAGALVPVFEDLTPNLTETGTSWTLSSTPAATSRVSVFLNGLKLKRVNAGPTAYQFTISGTTVTTGRSLTAGESLEAIYEAVGERTYWEDLTPNLTETGTNWTLTNTPVSGKIAVWLNGQKIRKVAAAPTSTQFTVSGTTLVTGRTLTAGESLETFYAF